MPRGVTSVDVDVLKSHIRDIPDFPQPGVVFKDITPLLADRDAFRATVDELVRRTDGQPIDKVLGIEARGFILAAPVAHALGAGFIPVRKAGKLPWEIEREEYELEYGTDLLEIHRDAVGPGHRVLVVDDVLATGGTASATGRLVERLGAELVGYAFAIELTFLHGRGKLGDHSAVSLITYQ